MVDISTGRDQVQTEEAGTQFAPENFGSGSSPVTVKCEMPTVIQSTLVQGTASESNGKR
jgi:hypothetical protein